MFASVVLFASLFINEAAFSENEWKKSLEKDNITVYTRNIESSNFNEFLTEAEMSGSIDEFRAIIMDIESYNSWMPDCKSVKIIDHPNPNEITYHMKLKVPFPFANRDVIQQLVLKEIDNTLEIEVRNRPKKVKVEKKYIRMQKASGKWVIQETSEKEIYVTFQYFADPGGEIPAWLVNSFIVKNPHITMLNIKKKLAEKISESGDL